MRSTDYKNDPKVPLYSSIVKAFLKSPDLPEKL